MLDLTVILHLVKANTAIVVYHFIDIANLYTTNFSLKVPFSPFSDSLNNKLSIGNI